MLTRTWTHYRRSFDGLTRDVWILALVMLINRSGAMVIPFLSVYLTQHLDFAKPQAGWIMSSLGFGSVLGSYLGGLLTDRYNYYWVQVSSLTLNGLLFLLLGWIEDFTWLCILFFLLAMVADAFRPANFAAVMAYSRPDSTTRSYSLVRLAVNLGFGVGPALGGLIAYGWGFRWLFVVDGLTCLGAALVFRLALQHKVEPSSKTPDRTTAGETTSTTASPFQDRPFRWFMLWMTLTYIAFIQYFSMVPVFLREKFGVAENQIGLVLAINGLVIALVEMPLVYRLEKNFRKTTLVMVGTALIAFSFLAFNLLPGVFAIALLSVLTLTFGEILHLPFANALALSRSNAQNRGRYMAMYTLAFSLAQIVAPTLGMQTINAWGFHTLWYLLGLLCVVALAGFYVLQKKQFDQPRIY